MAQTYNPTWGQGEDLLFELIYKEGATVETALPVDLSTNYAVRMDIVVPATGERVYTFNSAAIADVDPNEAGDQPDSTLEAALSNSDGSTPNVSILIPRSLTLPGGAVHAKMVASPAILSFGYDIFLRNTLNDRQVKILKGTITTDKSHTLWL